MAPVKWQDVARAKQSQRYASIPAEWRLPTSITDQISSKANISVLDIPENSGILTAKDLEITEKYDATDLLEMLRKKAFTSYEVTLAFCKRAAIAHQLVRAGYIQVDALTRTDLRPGELLYGNVLRPGTRESQVVG